jgi:heterodisulfide reductase subunit B
MRFSYYPGCSAHKTAKEYDASARALCRALGVELDVLTDWNCCGSSTLSHTNHQLSTALSLRNLILADAGEADLATICAFCFNQLKAVQLHIEGEPEIREAVERIMGESYRSQYSVRHLLDILFNDVGLQTLQERATRPLTGLKAVAYYGCLLVRPQDITGFDDPEHPVIMDQVLEAVGVECLDWSYKTECCGAGLSITRPDVARRLVRTLFTAADEAGADCLVTACPLCFTNLETRAENGRTPVFYFTELLGWALEIPEAEGWFKGHLISPDDVMKQVQVHSE